VGGGGEGGGRGETRNVSSKERGTLVRPQSLRSAENVCSSSPEADSRALAGRGGGEGGGERREARRRSNN